jgi:hypothetical protein
MIARSLPGSLSVPVVLLAASAAMGQEWSGPVRGSWVRQGDLQAGDVVLGAGNDAAEIVVAPAEHSAVKQAAEFLAGDIEKITGAHPPIVSAATGRVVAIHLETLADGQELPAGIARAKLDGQWEAYQILTAADGKAVWLVGSDPRGTAFAAYTLSERLGIDPLYRWTGYRPEKRDRLVQMKTDCFVASPTVKYRGLFHDDEDILPRPFDYHGHPLVIGDVPLEWYKAYFETALRLRMNMVAPYVRVHRRYEVQKTASDWGLYYTSHHYDILLSNPYGFDRFKLAEKRGVTGEWNWLTDREGMLKFWRGGVEENGKLDCIWPVGLRGTNDVGYSFPRGMPQSEQNKIFRQVIDAQIDMTRQLVAPEKRPPVFHFTLYNEMLNKYLGSGGKFEMPEDVILVWPDDNDGRMRALPKERGKWKHGVYYHLAYLGPVAKQVFHIVPPRRIANQFKKIADAQATEYVLVNVSELREFVMEARMIAEICWDSKTALADTPVPPPFDHVLPAVPTASKQPPPPDLPSHSADRYIRWWCAEYFGQAAAPQAAEVYHRYYSLINRWDRQWYASDKVDGALASLRKKFAGQDFSPARTDTLPTLQEIDRSSREALAIAEQAGAKMTRAQRQFFFENVEFPLLIVGRQAQAAILLVQAMAEPDGEKAWSLCEQAMSPLEQLEVDILRAQRPPFENWYIESWARSRDRNINIHRPYVHLRAFLSTGGRPDLADPNPKFPPDEVFLPILQDKE